MDNREKASKKEVIALHKRGESIRGIAIETGLGRIKVRKILITEGLHTSAKLEKVQSMYAQGMSIDDIAMQLHINPKRVNDYLPYTKGVYMDDDPSVNALRIRACRERKERKDK